MPTIMLLPVVIAAGAVLVLAHVAPFRFLIDKLHQDASAGGMRVPGARKPIYFTFDDGPNPAATPELLSLLKEKSVRATSFLIDEYVTEETAPIVRSMFEEGHCVGLHTARRWLFLRSPSHMAGMLADSAEKIERLTAIRAAATSGRTHGSGAKLCSRAPARLDTRLWAGAG